MHFVDLVGQPKKRWYQTKKRKIQVTVFLSVLFIGMTVSLIIPLRPEFSVIEKRELAKFPKFSVQAVFDGSYFKGIDAWYSDTFPFREDLTLLNSKLTSWYGFGNKISSLVENGGDDIPDVPKTTEEEGDTESTTQDTAESTSAASSEGTTVSSSENTSVPSSEEVSREPDTDKSTEPKPQPTQTLGAIMVSGNAGYEYYNFVTSTADKYISIINSAAKKLDGKAQVYDLIVPTSIDVTLDDVTRRSVSSSDQRKAIEYFYGSMSKKVKTVKMLDTLLEHRNEYVYYRTDHHWTALGAYYGYTAFAEVKGITPIDISKFEKVDYGRFLGSFYADSKQDKKLKKNADELIAYKPYYSTTLKFIDTKGTEITWPIVNDVSNYPENIKYSAFAAGDNPYTVIKNNDISKKSSCVIIKESFANAMIPYIAGSYQTVYVIDYRYWKGNLYDFVEKKNVKDVIFINNISATRNAPLVDKIGEICK